MNRRDFLKGFFSGVILLGATSVGSSALVQVYHAHDHYVAPGKFNIWYSHDHEWHLLSDSLNSPFEFNSSTQAEKYIATIGLKKYRAFSSRNSPVAVGNGTVFIKKGPTEIHDLTYMRMDLKEATAVVKEYCSPKSEVGDAFIKILVSRNGGIQADAWSQLLIGLKKVEKSILVGLVKDSVELNLIMRGLFIPYSYHSIKARLHTFQPIITRI